MMCSSTNAYLQRHFLLVYLGLTVYIRWDICGTQETLEMFTLNGRQETYAGVVVRLKTEEIGGNISLIVVNHRYENVSTVCKSDIFRPVPNVHASSGSQKARLLPATRLASLATCKSKICQRIRRACHRPPFPLNIQRLTDPPCALREKATRFFIILRILF